MEYQVNPTLKVRYTNEAFEEVTPTGGTVAGGRYQGVVYIGLYAVVVDVRTIYTLMGPGHPNRDEIMADVIEYDALVAAERKALDDDWYGAS